MPRVSVVIPCFNGADYIDACLDSLARQSEPDWEALVVDDKSTDSSLAASTRRAAQDRRVRVLSQPVNRGVAAARNAGAREATAPYLLFLDVDDVLEPAMLAVTCDHLERHAGVVIAYTGHSYIDADGRHLGVEAGAWPWARYLPSRFGVRKVERSVTDTGFASIYLVAAIIPSLAVIRRQAFARTRGWDESFGQLCEDTDMFLQLSLLGYVHFLDQPLVRYRQHAHQSTRTDGFAGQYSKLQLKWRDLQLPPAHRLTVDDAEWFRSRRFVPCEHARMGFEALRGGRFRNAARLLRAAARDYSPRRPPPSLARAPRRPVRSRILAGGRR